MKSLSSRVGWFSGWLLALVVSLIFLLGVSALFKPQQRAFAASCAGVPWDSGTAYTWGSGPQTVYYDDGNGYKDYTIATGTSPTGTTPPSALWNVHTPGYWGAGTACDLPTPTQTPTPLPTNTPTPTPNTPATVTSACAVYPTTLTNDFWSLYIFDDTQWDRANLTTGRVAVGGTFTYGNGDGGAGGGNAMGDNKSTSTDVDDTTGGGFGNNGSCTGTQSTAYDLLVNKFKNNVALNSDTDPANDPHGYLGAGMRYNSVSGTGDPGAARPTRCTTGTTPPTSAVFAGGVETFENLTSMNAVKIALMGAAAAATLPDGDDNPSSPFDLNATGTCTDASLAVAPYGYTNGKSTGDGLSYDLAGANGNFTDLPVVTTNATSGATGTSGVKASKNGTVLEIDASAATGTGDVYVNLKRSIFFSAVPTQYNITLAAGRKLIINLVSDNGTAFYLTGGSTALFNLTGGDESDLLWNAPTATLVDLAEPPGSFSFKGTILAPCGSITLKGGVVTGQLVSAQGSTGGYAKVTGNGFCSAATAPTSILLAKTSTDTSSWYNTQTLVIALVLGLLLAGGSVLTFSFRKR